MMDRLFANAHARRGCGDRLGAAAAAVAGLALFDLGFQTVAQLGREHALDQLFLELADQTRFVQDRLGILALHLGKRLIDQVFGLLLLLVTVASVIGCYFRYRFMTSAHVKSRLARSARPA